MRNELKVALGVAGLVAAAHASAQLTLYEHQGFRGPAFTINGTASNFSSGRNDRASSAVVENGRWEVCEDVHFEGKCVVLVPGSYDSLSSMNMNNVISSVRPVTQPVAAYEVRRRWRNRITSIAGGRTNASTRPNVTSVRAVVGAAPEQRCWVERQQVAEDRNNPNIPGAIIGGVLGGVLGHQIGSGRGNTVATAGGAVAGAAIGSNVGRDGRHTRRTFSVARMSRRTRVRLTMT
jgi:uncharacterized protein YcfJ